MSGSYHRFSLQEVFLLIFLIVIINGCKKDQRDEVATLNLISVNHLQLPETSGLSFYKNEQQFLTVSDTLGIVCVMTSAGEITDTLDYAGENPEGVAYHTRTNTIYVVEENASEIIEITTSGAEIRRFRIEVPAVAQKHGLEGITIDTATHTIYLLKEKDPGRLYKVTMAGEIRDSLDLNFALDYSSVFFDPYLKNLWIASDESMKIINCDTSGNMIHSYHTGVKKGEGLVVDSRLHKIYLVTDNSSRLYQFYYSVSYD